MDVFASFFKSKKSAKHIQYRLFIKLRKESV